jgi:hypothetical protein
MVMKIIVVMILGTLVIGSKFHRGSGQDSKAVALADPQQCIEEHCASQWAACQKDPKCVPALQTCQKKCGTSASCWTFCLPGQGSQPAIDVAKCAQANHCIGEVSLSEVSPFQQCMDKGCRTEVF